MIENKINKKRLEFAKGVSLRGRNPQAVIKVTGEDALQFLQGQFSQELRPGRAEAASYGLWLNRKGRIEGDSVVVRESAESCWILSWSLAATDLIARLEAFIIADDVQLEDETAAWRGWELLGPGITAWAAEASARGELRFAAPAPAAADCERMWVVAENEPRWPVEWAQADDRDVTRRRIVTGLPEVPGDAGAEDLPQEAGLVAAGVSFTKGCYLGQEVMARLQATGRVRRRLVRVLGPGAAPEAAAAGLYVGTKQVGELRSRIDLDDTAWAGLAMLSLASWSPGVKLALAPDGEAVIEVMEEDVG